MTTIIGNTYIAAIVLLVTLSLMSLIIGAIFSPPNDDNYDERTQPGMDDLGDGSF